MTKKLIIEDTDKIIEADRFLLLFEKMFNKYHEKNLKQKSLDCEDGVVTDFLTQAANKFREHILSDAQCSKAAKFLEIISSFFQSVFNIK